MRQDAKVVLAALAGATIAVLTAVLVDPRPWLLNSSAGQRMLQAFMDWRAPVTPGAPRIREGDTIKNVPVQLLDGGSMALHEALGPQRTLIALWAGWCGPCLKEMPLLSAYSASQSTTKVIGVGMDDINNLKAVLQRQPTRFQHFQVPEPPRFTPAGLGNPSGALPFTVLVDAQGKVLARRTGAFHTSKEIAAWVNSVPY